MVAGIEKEEFWTVSYHELDELVKETYGHDFEVVAALELSNDSCAEVRVDKEQERDEWTQRQWTEWIEDGEYSYGTTGQILNDLCRQEIIPEGRYLIRVCW